MNRSAVALMILALGATMAPSAIACNPLDPNPRALSRAGNSAKKRTLPRLPSLAASLSPNLRSATSDDSNHTIAGLWESIYYDGDTPVDDAFEVFYADGMELLNDASSVLEGNVCVGVWSQTGPRTFALHHVSWLFDDSGNPVGRSIQDSVMTVDPSGMSFTGTGTGAAYDLDGNLLGSGSGTVKGQRITVPGDTSTTAVAGPKGATTVQRDFALNGTASTSADGLPLTYFWTLGKGSLPAAISHADSATPTVEFTPIRGQYTFLLTVTDSKGGMSTDTVTVDYEGR